MTWDVSLVYRSLYIFVNKAIIERRALKAWWDFQLWLLHFSTALLGPVSTLFPISQAANRIPLLSPYFSILFCTVLCSCLVSVFFICTVVSLVEFKMFVFPNDIKTGILVYFHITPSITGRGCWHSVSFFKVKPGWFYYFAVYCFLLFPLDWENGDFIGLIFSANITSYS